MAIIFLDGFDKYGPPVSSGPNAYPATTDIMLAGDWTSGVGSTTITQGLSGVGYAVSVAGTFFKTLSANYPTLIAGARFNSQLTGGDVAFYFYDGTSAQSGVGIQSTTGRLYVKTGGSTIVYMTPGPVASAGVTHHLEVQLTFSNPGTYLAYIDGVLVASGTGNLKTTSNSFANGFTISGNLIYDDLYLMDTSGSINNAPLLTQPIVETTYPVSDTQTQFTNAASIIGTAHTDNWQSGAPPNSLVLVGPYKSTIAVSMQSISTWIRTTSTSANFKAVIYADNAGSPIGGALLATSLQTTGSIANTELRCNFSSPVSIAANTLYWLGFINDTNITYSGLPLNPSTGLRVNNTYTSGPPSTAPSGLFTVSGFACWGNCTGSTKNWISENITGPPGDYSYIISSIVGTEDLYGVSPLQVTPSFIYGTTAKIYARRSDNGSRTAGVKLKSGAVDSSGTSTNMVPGTTYTWLASYWDRDPNGNILWTKANLDAALIGPQVTS